MTDRDIQNAALLEATLAHVPFDGWTAAALKHGARTLGLSRADVLIAFPGGAIDALEAFLRRADIHMLETMSDHDLDAMRVHERVTLAVRLRLEANAPYREAIRRGLSVLALPQNIGLAARSLYRTVDAIWYAAGDRATDYNYYTKRMLLAGVYSSTLIYWLDDSSDDFADSWAFLDRRIKDVGQVPKAIGRIKKLVDGLPDPFRMMRPRPSRR
ncbi:MAG: COQ9 family protein [Alphaproteobacteria bacterium]|nr:COQ9 family protein [Alphaproteobacteria bacterium]